MERFGAVLVWISALGTLLIAGVFFTFSSFIMAALDRIPAQHAISAMNSINVTVINPVFMMIFMGTGLVCVLLMALNISNVSDHHSLRIVIAAAIYLLGSILVTMAFNVPLNNALANADPASAEGLMLWTSYSGTWTFWNHVRGAASLISGVFFLSALT